MATTVDPKAGSNSDPPGDDDEETFFIPGEPVNTPAADDKYTSTEREYEMYEEIKWLARIITKVDDFLKQKHPELLITMEKMKLFDGTVDGMNLGSKEGSHPSSYNLDPDLEAESERKPGAQREDRREEKPLCMDTSMVARGKA